MTRSRPDWLLIGLMTAALAVRIWGIADRLPDPTLGLNPIIGDTSVDEGDRRAMLYAWEMWQGGTRPLDLNPRTGDWPGLPFYATLGAQVLYRAYDSLAHGAATAQEFARHVARDPAGMFLFARFLNALLGVLTVFLTYLLGSRLGGRQVGLVAALLLAFTPFHILISQRVSDPNLLALAFVLLASILLVGGGEEHRARTSGIAGAMIGLAGACKYVPLALNFLLAIACIDRARGAALRVRWRPLAAGLLASLLAFALASPYTLLDWSAKARDMQLQRGRLLGEWVGLSESSVSLPTYLVRTLPHMLGWPVYLLSIAGSALLLVDRRRRGWIVALTPLVLLLPTGLLAVAQERFMAPALGSLIVAAAFAIVRAAAWSTQRFHAPSRAVAAAALVVPIAVTFAWAAPEYLRTREALRLPDTRHLAHRWIETSIPRTEPIAMDLYGPEFNAEEEGRLSLVWPFLATQAEYVRAAYHAEWLDGLRYYVTSEEVGRRFEAAADRYPAEAAFHRWIRSRGRLAWSTDSVTASGPRIEVWALPDRISDPEQRVRLWDEARRQPMYDLRLAHWCRDMATIFLKQDQYSRAAEWAARGLTVRDRAFRRDLFETLALAQVRLGRPSEAVTAAREGSSEFPESPLLHLDCAMALEALSRSDEAIVEYRAALRQSPTPGASKLIQGLLTRLEGSRPRP